MNILNGNSPEHELPHKDARRVANRGGLTSGYKGATKSKNKWKATITRCGATVNLGSYDNELIAAVVAQVADKEIPELSHTPRKRARPLPTEAEPETETENLSETDSDAEHGAPTPPMPTRSTHHQETLAKNRRLNDEVQLLKNDMRELWRMIHTAYGNWHKEELMSRKLQERNDRLVQQLYELDPNITPLCSPPRTPTPPQSPTPPPPPTSSADQ